MGAPFCRSEPTIPVILAHDSRELRQTGVLGANLRRVKREPQGIEAQNTYSMLRSLPVSATCSSSVLPRGLGRFNLCDLRSGGAVVGIKFQFLLEFGQSAR